MTAPSGGPKAQPSFSGCTSRTNSLCVANRIAQIHDLTTIDECNHVQSADKPADVGTHGIATSAFLENNWL